MGGCVFHFIVDRLRFETITCHRKQTHYFWGCMDWKRFKKRKLIGSGNFGQVYKVTTHSDNVRALKIINDEFLDLRPQFRSAFETARKLNDLNCLKTYEWISDNEICWTMEYVEGKPLSSLHFTNAKSLDRILKLMIQICNGLIALHSRNIVHRDLKPFNILINSNGTAKITDFDLIKTSFTEYHQNKFFGTPEYASPEHFISSYELDTRSDLYSLGVILYELLIGKFPFTGDSAKEIGDQHRVKPILIPSKINPKIPPKVENVILGLLEKEPKDRYQHAHAVAKDLWNELSDKKGIKLKKDVSYLLKPKFVNRTSPLRKLHKLSDDLKENTGNVVLILGESGIGKTKLIQQFYYQLQLQDINFYRSICKTVESAFNPLRKIFEKITLNLSEPEKLKCFGQFGWDLVKFGILTEQKWMHKIEKPIDLSVKNTEIRLFGAITDFLKETASKPIVICIDDLHWADEQILKWLKFAVRNLKDFPVLIIGLHRTEMMFEDSTLFKIENLTQINIKNLKEIDVSEMIKSMLGKKRKNKKMNNFIENIVSHTNGNPLFIREMLYFLNEKGKISIIKNRWNFPPKIEIEILPESVQKVIQERMEELSLESLQTLQIASIIGKKFSFEILLHLTKKKENELLEDLIDCREVSLLEESGNDLVFIHDKIREVLESELKDKNPEKWQELHQKAGEFLEEKYSQNIDEALDELVDHFYKARDEEKAIKYLVMAGNKAMKHFQNTKAIEHYSKLKTLIETSFKQNRHQADYFLFLKKLLYKAIDGKGRSYFQMGQINKAFIDYNSALEIAKELNDKTNLQRNYHDIGWCYVFEYDYVNARKYLEKGLKLAEELNLKSELARSVSSVGNLFVREGNFEKHFEYQFRCLEILEEIDDDYSLAGVYSNIGTGYLNQGNYEEALRYYHKCLKVSEKTKVYKGYSFRYNDAVVYRNFGRTYRNLGEFDKAIKYYKKSSAISDEINDKSEFGLRIMEIGVIYYYKKNYQKALKYIDKAIRIQEEFGLNDDLYFSLIWKIDILFDQNKYLKARKIFQTFLKCLPKSLSSASFNAKVYQARISFHLAKSNKIKIEKGINPLEEMLKVEKDEERIAGLNHELWKFKKEISAELAEENRITALNIYRNFYKMVPKFQYKRKIDELENTTSEIK